MRKVLEEAIKIWENALDDFSSFLLYLLCGLIIISLPLWIIPYKLITRKKDNKQ